MTEMLLVLYFTVLFGTLLFKSRAIHSRWLFLLRAFFPNWKFFDVVGHVPHLMARSAQGDGAGQLVWSDWMLIYPRRVRRWWHVFHKAQFALGRHDRISH